MLNIKIKILLITNLPYFGKCLDLKIKILRIAARKQIASLVQMKEKGVEQNSDALHKNSKK